MKVMKRHFAVGFRSKLQFKKDAGHFLCFFWCMKSLSGLGLDLQMVSGLDVDFLWSWWRLGPAWCRLDLNTGLSSFLRCVLGNTTILAEFAGEEEVNRFFAQGQTLGANTTSWQANPGTNQNRMGAAQPHAIGQWSSGGGAGGGGAGGGGGGAKPGGGDLLWGGVPQYSSLWGPPGGDDARVIGSPTPINTLLPGDLLSGESM